MARGRDGGMTLVEMAVALAIAGMLAAATLRVTSRMARRGKWLDSAQASTIRNEGIGRMLEIDLLNAEQFRPLRQGGDTGKGGRAVTGLELRTHAALRPGGLETVHVPAVVSYEIVDVNGTKWLVRRQAGLADASARPVSELVCRGVEAVELAAGGSAARTGWRAAPARCEVRIRLGGDGKMRDRELSFTYRLR